MFLDSGGNDAIHAHIAAFDRMVGVANFIWTDEAPFRSSLLHGIKGYG